MVGMDDLAEQIKGGDMNFDVVIATPTPCAWWASWVRFWAPRPDAQPQGGHRTADVETAVKNAKAGQVRYRPTRPASSTARSARSTFEVSALKENLSALLADLIKLKPAAAKGQYMQKVAVSTTMGPGLRSITIRSRIK